MYHLQRRLEPQKSCDGFLQRGCLRKLELHLGSRGNHQCAGGEAVPRLLRRPLRASGLDAIRPYRDIAAVH